MSDNENDNWINNLPDELKEAPYIGKAESPADALAKLQHAAKLVGSSVRIPGEDASDEDRNAFYEKVIGIDGIARMPTHDDIDGVMDLLGKLGYPEEHTGYKLPELADFEWDETVGEQLRKYAHESGMTPGQFTAFASRIAKQEQEADIAAENALAEAQKALRTDWGDTLEERESLIRGWLEHSEAPEGMKEMLNNRQFSLDDMNWLLAVAKQFKGDVTPISKDGKSPTPALTPAEIKIEIQSVLNDLTDMRESDPRYVGLRQKLVSLHKDLASAGEAA